MTLCIDQVSPLSIFASKANKPMIRTSASQMPPISQSVHPTHLTNLLLQAREERQTVETNVAHFLGKARRVYSVILTKQEQKHWNKRPTVAKHNLKWPIQLQGYSIESSRFPELASAQDKFCPRASSRCH